MRRIGYEASDFDRLNVVHVAGTKGKGTTCAYVNSMLSHVGQRYGRPGKIGLYTSPHLVSVRERIRINSEPITEEQFTKYFFEVWERLESSAEREGIDPSEKPTYFRMMTVLSFHVFMRENVDTAVYEVGVGGELDSTNIVERPAVTGITTLGIDHVETLGDTVDKIAWHKAGIFKPGSPAFSVRQLPLATPVLVDRAEEKNVDLKWVDISPEVRQVKIQPQEDFQFKNASLAVELTKSVLKTLDINIEAESGPSKKSTALPDEFVRGLESVVWRARGETKTVGKQTYYLDGAHTEDSLGIVGNWFGKTTKKRFDPLEQVYTSVYHSTQSD
jgi:folylpolyglutamate synthase